MWASPRLRLAALDLVCTSGAVALWSGSSGQAGPLPLMLALVPHGARMQANRPVWKGTVFDVPLALFLLTALAGTWLATDRAAAWAKWWLIVAALLTYLALARQPARNVWAVVSGLGFLSAGAAIYFLLTHDWQAYPAKFDGLEVLAGPWMAIRPELGLPALHPNVAASLVALLSPYLVVTAGRARRLHKHRLWRAAIIALALSGTALILAASRGAILALGAALLLWLLWQAGVKAGARLDVPPLAISMLPALIILLLASPAVNAFGGPIAILDQLPGPASASNRALLTQETVALVADYPLTGAGLASFPGLYSRYILNIPFFMLPNGHNIFLDVWLERGVLGLLALLAVVGGSFWLLAQGGGKQASEPDSLRPVRWAIASSMLVILVHGLVEDTVYGSVLASAFRRAGPRRSPEPAAPAGCMVTYLARWRSSRCRPPFLAGDAGALVCQLGCRANGANRAERLAERRMG
jgi:O-antigen ligase